MAKKQTYADRLRAEKLPVANGTQYRAEAVRVPECCTGCAARACGEIDKALCNALPPCTKGKRLDGLNVRYVACGKAAG